MAADWVAARTEYITTNISYRELAKKYGLSVRQISQVGKDEGWYALKKQNLARIATEAEAAAIDGSRKRYAAMQDAAVALLEKTREGIRDADAGDGKLLRAYSGVLRDVKEVLDLRSELDVAEQEARIEKLRRDAEKDSGGGTEVSIELGGAEEWAR